MKTIRITFNAVKDTENAHNTVQFHCFLAA